MTLFPIVKEIIDSLQNDLAMEVYKMSPLGNPNQLFVRRKELDNCVFDTLGFFSQTNECQ